jgi:plastocyanin
MVILSWRWLRSAGTVCLLAALAAGVRAQSVAEVRIESYRYEPAAVSIKTGDSVRWLNGEKRTSHSILFPAEGGRESERIFPGESWERRFDRAGRYEYRCGPHPEMKGVVVVAD